MHPLPVTHPLMGEEVLPVGYILTHEGGDQFVSDFGFVLTIPQAHDRLMWASTPEQARVIQRGLLAPA
jgi:hypothetical protein